MDSPYTGVGQRMNADESEAPAPTHLYNVNEENFSVWSFLPPPKKIKSIFDDMVPVGEAPKKGTVK